MTTSSCSWGLFFQRRLVANVVNCLHYHLMSRAGVISHASRVQVAILAYSLYLGLGDML